MKPSPPPPPHGAGTPKEVTACHVAYVLLLADTRGPFANSANPILGDVLVIPAGTKGFSTL
jgi:hypothetical protein